MSIHPQYVPLIQLPDPQILHGETTQKLSNKILIHYLIYLDMSKIITLISLYLLVKMSLRALDDILGFSLSGLSIVDIFVAKAFIDFADFTEFCSNACCC